MQLYLERGGRALATDLLDIDAPVSGVRGGLEDFEPFDWWREMDRPRASFGNDAAWNGQRADVEALHPLAEPHRRHRACAPAQARHGAQAL